MAQFTYFYFYIFAYFFFLLSYILCATHQSNCNITEFLPRVSIKYFWFLFLLGTEEIGTLAKCLIIHHKVSVDYLLSESKLGNYGYQLAVAEQAIYYEEAEKKRQLHAQQHPGWSSGDNYLCTRCWHTTLTCKKQYTRV